MIEYLPAKWFSCFDALCRFLKYNFKLLLPAKKEFLPVRVMLLFITVFLLLPFAGFAQFPYNETFRNATAPSVHFGGAPTAFLTAAPSSKVGDAVGEGYLRLTSDTTFRKGYIYSDAVFMGNYGLKIEFEYFAYPGTTNGADGLSFFLFDASVPSFNIGGFGGSLGYAQYNSDDSPNTPGVSGGYLGIGIDEWGNFGTKGEGRQGGGSSAVKSRVTLRGAGNGSARVDTNYPWLATKATLTTDVAEQFTISGGSRTATSPGVTGYRKVFVDLKPRPGGGLFVNISIQHENVITPIFTNYEYKTPIPPNGLKYGIASSTGASKNVHEIRGLSLTVDPENLATPTANNDSRTTCQGYSKDVDLLTNDVFPNASGKVNEKTVDLDPTTTAVEQDVTKSGVGRFVFDQATLLLTFIPEPTFNGTATINYNFKDVYGKLSTTGTVSIATVLPVISTPANNMTACEGGTTKTSIVVNDGGNGTSVTYQWQKLNGSNWENISLTDPVLTGSTTRELTVVNSPYVLNGSKFRAVVTSKTGDCTALSNTATLTVNPKVDVNDVPNQNLCNGNNTNAITFGGPVTGTTFTWTNNTPSIGLAASGSGNILAFNAVNTGATAVTATVIVTAVSPQGCAGNSKTFTITVNPTATVNTIPNQDICNGAKNTAITFGGAVAGTTYSWTNDNSSIGIAASGTGDIPATALVNTGNTIITATFTVTPTSPNGCVGTAKTFTIKVYPTATVSTLSNQELCNNANTTAVNFNGPVVGTTYSWTNNNTSIGLAASGTGNISSFKVVNTSFDSVTATITVTPTNTNGCAGTPSTFTITVNPTANMVQPLGQEVCNNANSSAINFSGDVASTTYSWTNNTPGIGLAASGTGNIGSFKAVNLGTAVITATITVTPSTPKGCPGASRTFEIKVFPTAKVVKSGDQVICNTASSAVVNFTGGVDGEIFTWTNNKAEIGLAASGTGNIAAFTAVNTTFAPIVATITVTPTTAKGCAGTPETFTITVMPTANVKKPAPQTICNNAATALITFASDVDGAIFNWKNDKPGIGLAATGTGDIASFKAVNITNEPITATITVTPTTARGCAGESKTFTITVMPMANVAKPVDVVICNNASSSVITFSGDIAGTTYSWTNNTPGIGLASSGTGNIESFTALNTTFSPITATITVTPTTDGGCAGTPQTFDIKVMPTANVKQPGDQTICNTASTTAINFASDVNGTIYNWTNNLSGIGLAASGTGNINSFTAVNATNSPVVATITVTPTTAGGCAGSPKTFTITVLPTANVATVANQEVCNKSNTTAINFSGTVDNTIFNWTNDTPGIGLVESGTGNIASFVAINTTNAPIKATITVTPTTEGGCAGTPKTFTITVMPTANVVKPADQVLCNNASTAAIDFDGNVNGTIFNWTNDKPEMGLATSGTGNIASFTALNITFASITSTITVTPTTVGGCAGEPKIFTIRVMPTANVKQPVSQEICNNAPTTAVTFESDVDGTIFNWTNNQPSIGLAANGTGTIASFTAVNVTNEPITATITVTPITEGGCTGAPKTFTIKVMPTANVTKPADVEICNNASSSVIIFSGSVATTVFNWTNNTPEIELAASGTGNIESFRAVNTTFFPITATITVTPTTAGGCAGTPQTFTIKVMPTANVKQPASQTICNTVATNAFSFASDVDGTIYNWTNNQPGIGLAVTGSGNINSFTAVNTTNEPITATITVTPTTAGGCAGSPKTFTITVLPTANVAPVANQEICNKANTTAINFSGTVNTTIFNWTKDKSEIGLAASGTGNIAAFAAINATNAPIVATITVTPTTEGACAGPPQSFTITVMPTATVVKPVDQVLCNNAPTAAIPFAGNVDGTIFNWTNDKAEIGLATSGTGNIASFTAVNTTFAPITATITVIPTTAKGCAGESKTFTIKVMPTANVKQPAPQEICNNASTTAVTFESDVDGAIYNWTNDKPGIGLPATGTGNIGSFTALNTTNEPIEATITVTPTTEGGCAGVPRTFVIKVMPTATVAQPIDVEICNNASSSVITFSGNVANTIFKWTNNTLEIGLAASGTGNIESFKAINTTFLPITATITVTPTTAGGCAGTPQTFTIKVMPTANVKQPDNQTICNTAATAAVNFASDVDGTIYNWTNDQSGIGLATSGTGNINSFTAVNLTNLPIEAKIIVTPTTAGGCAGLPKTCTITVMPTANVASVANLEICNNVKTTTISFSGTVANTIFKWANDKSGIGLAASGTGDIAAFTAINTTNVPIMATITVTPTTEGACAGEPKTFTITVLPTANVKQPENQTICNTASTATVAFDGDVAGTIFNWTNDKQEIGLAASGLGNIASFTAINTTYSPITATITVTPTTAKGCAGESKTITIKVMPTANVKQPAPQEICNNAYTTAVTFESDVEGAIFNWTNDKPSIGLPGSGTGNIGSFTAVNITNSPIEATITVTPTTEGGCAGAPKTFTIKVMPTATVAKPIDVEICNNASSSVITFSGDIANTIFNWTNNTPGIGLAGSGTGNMESFTAVNTTFSPVTAMITVTPTTAGGCAGTPQTFIIKVMPTANVKQPDNQKICNTAPTVAVTFDSDVNGTIYNWTNNQPGIGLAANGTGNISSFTAVNTTNLPIEATITVTPTTAGACAGSPKTFTITVMPTANVVKPNDQEKCNTAATDAITFAGDVVGTIYNWRNNTPGIGLAASGTGDIASFPAVNTSNEVIIATITVTPTSLTRCAGDAKSFTITVMPTANVVKPLDQVKCNTVATDAIRFDGDVAGTIFNWTNDKPEIGLAISGTGNIASFTAINTTFAPIKATITVTPTTAKSCAGESKTFTITVMPTANVKQPASQEICNNASTVAVTFESDVDGTIYNWTNDKPGIGLARSGTGNIARFTAINTTNEPITATITVTPTTLGGCAGEPKTFTITVLPTANVVRPLDQVKCNTAATDAITFTGDVTNTIYNWTNDKPGIGLAASGTGDIASFTAVNTTFLPITATITVTPTTLGNCAGEAKTFTITVMPTANVKQPGNQTICNTASIAVVTFDSDVDGTIYNWTNNQPGIGLPAIGTGNIASFAAVNTGKEPIVATIIVTPTTEKDCAGPPKTFTITVMPTANVVKPLDQVKCNTIATDAITFAGDVAGTIYNWTNDTPGIGLAGSGTGAIASFKAVNTTHAPIIATITVTPTTLGSCTGEAKTFTITVMPTANVAKPLDQVKCNTANTDLVVFSGDVTGTIYNWTNDNQNIGLAASGTGNIASFKAVNTSFRPVTATITVTPTTEGGCEGKPETFKIIMMPTANVAKPADQIKCNTVVTDAITFTGDVDGTIYNWTNNTPSIGLSASGTGNITSFKAINRTNQPVVATIIVTPTTAGACEGESKSFTITVNPTATVAQPGNQVLCNTTTSLAVDFSGTVDGTTYEWANDRASIGLAGSGTGNIPAFTGSNTTFQPLTANITVTPISPSGCAGEAKIFTITVMPTANVVKPADQTLCNNTNTAAIFFTGDVAGTIYNWTNNNPSIGIAASGSGNIASFKAINTSNAPVVATITVTPTTNGGCAGEAKVLTITVLPNASVSLGSESSTANQAICVNTAVAPITYVVLNGTNAKVTGLPAGLTGLYENGNFVISGVATQAGSFAYVVTTVGGCAVAEQRGVITVRPDVELSLKSLPATAQQSVCQNANINLISYQTVNANGAVVTGLPTGVNPVFVNGMLNITGVPSEYGTFNYKVVVSGLCTSAEISGRLVVNPPPIGYNDLVNTVTCDNKNLSYNLQDNLNNTAKGGNAVPATFTWTVASNRNVTGQANGSGNAINAVLINHGHSAEQVIYTVTPTAVAGGCPGKAFTVIVNVPVCSSLSITKTAAVSVVSQAGDQIRYTITVKNTGTAIHSGVVVKDPYLGGVLNRQSGDNGNQLLDAGESWIYGGTYIVKQADIDKFGKPVAGSGNIVNTASVVSAEQPTELTAVSTVAIVTTGKLTLVKTGVMKTDFSTIVYTFNITNTGKTILHGLELVDNKFPAKLTLSKAVIEVGETIMAQATYTVTDQEKRDGVVINSATATGLTPGGEKVSAISGTDFSNTNPTEHIIDDAPQALNDNASTVINEPVKFTIADNDLPSFNGLDKGSIVIVSYPANGTVSVNADGTVIYTPNRGFSGPDQFTYTITDLKGKVSNVTLVSLDIVPIPLFIPNTFTPNGDGKNDTFVIIGRESYDAIELTVINRWGNEVYRSANYQNDWAGSGLNEGTYYYILTLKKGSDKVVKKGWVLLKR